PLTNGEKVDVTAKDEAGNVSDKTEVTAPDSTAPNAPSDVVISEDGSTVTGKAEPGSTVEIKDKDGNILGSGTADENGDFTVGLDTPLTNGEKVDVTAKDEAGNVSDKTEVTAPDSTAPNAPSDVVISEDGSTVTGKAEPGSTVEIKDKDGNILGSGTADENGDFTVGLDTPLTNGEKVDVTAKDEAGNVSDKTEVTAPDSTAPNAPSDVVISEDGSTVTGKAEPGSTVEIKDKDGNILGSGTADENGDFTVGLDTPLTNGEKVDVTAKDEAGNVSDKTEVTAPDSTAPNAPSDVVISEDGSTVTGKAEPGSTVEIKDKDGNILGSGTADENGDFTVGLDTPLTNGEKVDVTAKDEAGNVSDKTEVTAPDSTAPDAPSDVVISEDGSTVTGKAEPGSTVEIKDKDGNILGSGTADENGDFTVGLDTPLTNGEKVDVTAKDEAGNVSDKTEVTAPDSTAPNAPSDVVISEDGSTVTGKAEPGSTVEIKDKDGNILGSGTADENGDFTVGLDTPLTNGEKVDVTAKDEAGNVSDKTEVTAP
ncbi:Ig-like domain repeat protein, partial [Acinetobacter sp. R933-2]|uniref:Ig-like domain-containing protein n=1 Tax=Acinetobacter sp. R933-2 TaxID=2746728 RepID=UPI0025761A0A